LEAVRRRKSCRSAGAKGILFGKGFEQDFAPLELHQYDPRVVSERGRGTAKDSVRACAPLEHECEFELVRPWSM